MKVKYFSWRMTKHGFKELNLFWKITICVGFLSILGLPCIRRPIFLLLVPKYIVFVLFVCQNAIHRELSRYRILPDVEYLHFKKHRYLYKNGYYLDKKEVLEILRYKLDTQNKNLKKLFEFFDERDVHIENDLRKGCILLASKPELGFWYCVYFDTNIGGMRMTFGENSPNLTLQDMITNHLDLNLYLLNPYDDDYVDFRDMLEDNDNVKIPSLDPVK